MSAALQLFNRHHHAAQFRPMLQADLAVVAAHDALLHSHPWSAQAFSEALQAGYSAWVLERDTEIIAYGVWLRGVDDAELLNISVGLAHQKQAWGAALLQRFCADAQGLGLQRMLLEVRRSNNAALALYQQQGFTQLAVRKAYYQAGVGREDALIMQRSLEAA